MAIPKELEPLVEGFTAEEKTIFDNLLTKQAQAAKAKDPNAPTLAEGWLRQSDYDRKQNLSKAEVDKAQKRTQELEDWYKDNEPIHKAALERSRELEAKYAEVEQQLNEARARRAAEGGDQVDAAELEKRVKEEMTKLQATYGYVTKADTEKIIQEQTVKLAQDESKKFIDEASKKFFEETLPATANFAADIAEICFDHKSEFGEYLDRKKLAEFMTERKLINPKDGYAEFVKPQRDERAFKLRVDEEVKQRVSGMALNGNMVSPTGAVMPKGAIQMKVEKDAAAAGNNLNVLVNQAAQELRQEGKF